MKERTIIKISLIVFIISIYILTIFLLNLEPNITPISEINEHNIDSFVKIKGKIIDIQEMRNKDSGIPYMSVLTINDISSIQAILRENHSFVKNDLVEIIGKVSEYKGMIQIEIKSIKKV